MFDAFYRYKDALDDLINVGDNTDLDGSYSRFPEKALRIAMLLASFSNGGRIEITHWARAQAITERWRQSLHHLIDQLGQSDDSPERVLEDKIARLFTRHATLTAREVGRHLHISTSEAERMLDQLVKSGALQVEPGKRTKRYRATAATVTSVTVSHVSHPAKSCDTSPEAPTPVDEVSQELERCDTMTYVTVATLPAEEPATAVSVRAWSDGPEQVEVSTDRGQESMDGGMSKADAQRQATTEARTSLSAQQVDLEALAYRPVIPRRKPNINSILARRSSQPPLTSEEVLNDEPD